jgi:hypothetical protein
MRQAKLAQAWRMEEEEEREEGAIGEGQTKRRDDNGLWKR